MRVVLLIGDLGAVFVEREDRREDISPYERTLLHNVALRRPHAQLVAHMSNVTSGLPIAERAFAAVVVSRGIVNLYYGNRRKLDKISIGQVWKPAAQVK